MTERFVVIGAGTMGAGIAYVAAGAGYQVNLVDVDPAIGQLALEQIRSWVAKAVARDRYTAEQAETTLAHVTSLTDLTKVPAGVKVVVEAVPERADLKQRVLRSAEQLDPVLLASNTSSISIDSLAEGLERPERFCGLHFFNPVYAMALLEIVVGTRTDEATRRTAVEVAEALGKQPIVVADAPGFATSRLGNALGLEAIRMVESKVASAADIDKAMALGYRHPMGPLELTDVVGLDVRLDIARTLQQAYGDRFAPPDLLVKMVAAGKLGRKSGEGFYRWADGKRVG